MKVYISGPMTNVENYNKTAFDQAELSLRAIGLDVVNPHSLSDGVFEAFRARGLEPVRSDFMKVDIVELCACDAVYMLPGWEKSWGAKWERIIAKYIINIPVYYSLNDLPIL